MYPSDYGYATSGGSTSNRTGCLKNGLYYWNGASDCYNNDWLLDSSNWQWALSPNAASESAIYVFGVAGSGLVNTGAAREAGLVRPSVYLIPSTSILGGEGSETNPYILGTEN